MENILKEVKTVLDGAKVPNEVGAFNKEPAPETFAVVVPLNEMFENADDYPQQEVQAARIALYSKHNYRQIARTITEGLLAAQMSVSDRRYVEHEDDTGYHHYEIEIEKNYEWEETT